MPMSKAMSEAFKAKDKAKYNAQAKAYKEKKKRASAIISARRVSCKEGSNK